MIDPYRILDKDFCSSVVPYYALLVMAIGAIYPFYTKKWNTSIVDICFSVLKVVGVVFGVLYCLKVGPSLVLYQMWAGFYEN